MRQAILGISAAFFASIVTFPVFAQQLEPLQAARIKDKDDVVLDPNKAYLLVESDQPITSNFIRLPTDAERENWELQRTSALQEAIEEYPDKFAKYQRKLENIRKNGSRVSPPTPPLDPETSFGWPEIEQYRTLSMGPLHRFAKQKNQSLYLYEVEAGQYAFYGTGFFGFNDCMCMGTVSFPVAAGAVTTLRVHMQKLDAAGNVIESFPEGLSSTDQMTRVGIALMPPTEFGYDPRIPREMIKAAEFQVVGRLGNWFGGRVHRLAPVDGILAYDKDRIVDVRAEEEARMLAETKAQAVEEARVAAQATVQAAMDEAGQSAPKEELADDTPAM